ncbi:hypothetical protein EQO05_00520 [Methanosarcina sp. MSH10X1]|uniref:hypothetical protein n=1 Tax=Methanosarcina sp. MSH10X1 TaxID=2507075 RepID=UPI000FFBFBE9|nr:hypothetical protein [Methanosarcina sp. MSH10X1]RXA21767.1 hypothetical protein EQO05_00520 [Methanosarcina sp. MSH10X1]
MMRITSLNSMSLAKVLSLMYLTLAIVFSPFLLLVSTMDGTGLTEGIFVIVLFVVFYGIAGAIAGFLIGTIYTVIAKQVGGIEMEIETA